MFENDLTVLLMGSILMKYEPAAVVSEASAEVR